MTTDASDLSPRRIPLPSELANMLRRFHRTDRKPDQPVEQKVNTNTSDTPPAQRP
jgi:hypothetical protein